jgi:TonB family protein
MMRCPRLAAREIGRGVRLVAVVASHGTWTSLARRLPKELLRQKREGEVALQVQLDPRGHVKAIAVAASDLPPEFDAFLVEAVRGWRFTPPTRAGRPATAMVRLPIPIRVD